MPDIVFGKYRLIAELGRGGMADVFLAVSTGPAGLGFNKLVVIKRLREHLASDPEFMSMLVDEARIAARLNHPNVIQMIDIGESEGGYFLAMEFLDGQPLNRIRTRARDKGRPLPERIEYSILVDVLAGLQHAHELRDYDGSRLQVVHRDVTPHNVFVTYDGQVKVVDFGIAKAVGRTTETQHGIVKGKATYMAPEQASASGVDRRADIFSVGVMLWEAAVGERMWKDAGDDHRIIRRLIRGDYQPSPRAVRPDVPAAIDAICRRALAHDAADRFATAAEFEAELVAYLDAGAARVPDRELGVHVSELFSREREETKRVIEEQLAQIATDVNLPLARFGTDPSLVSGSSSLGPASGRSGAVGFGSLPLSDRQFDPTASTVLANDAPRDALQSAPVTRRPRSLKLAALAAVGALALGVAVWAFVNRSAVQSETTASAGPAPQVVLTLRANPPETRFSVDDGPPLGNPYSATVPRDGAPHRIRASAPGYTTITETSTFADDVSLRLELAPEKGTDAGSARAPSTVPSHGQR